MKDMDISKDTCWFVVGQVVWSQHIVKLEYFFMFLWKIKYFLYSWVINRTAINFDWNFGKTQSFFSHFLYSSIIFSQPVILFYCIFDQFDRSKLTAADFNHRSTIISTLGWFFKKLFFKMLSFKDNLIKMYETSCKLSQISQISIFWKRLWKYSNTCKSKRRVEIQFWLFSLSTIYILAFSLWSLLALM